MSAIAKKISLNRSSRITIRASFVAALVLFVSYLPVASAAALLKRGSGAVVTVQAERLPDYLKFDGSPVRNMVRVKVNYALPGSNPESYEEFFYADGEVVGLRRLRELGMNPMSSYVINVTQKEDTGSADELRAGANAALRLWMNLKRRHCVLTSIVVPDGALLSVAEELQRLRFQAVEAPSEGTLEYSTILTVFEAHTGVQRYFAYMR